MPMKLLYAAGLMQDAHEQVDHRQPPQQLVAEAVTPAQGAYVANMCLGCHGAHLSGGRIPGAPPDWPAVHTVAVELARATGSQRLTPQGLAER
jgi:hypothetical protein